MATTKAASKKPDRRGGWLSKKEKSGETVVPFYGYLPIELYKEARQFAFDNQISKSELQRRAFREYLERHKTKT